MTTYNNVRDAIKTAVFGVTTNAGYSRTLLSANFCKNWEAAKQNKDKPEKYPKTFLSIGDVQSVNAVGRRKDISATYYLTIVVLEAVDTRIHGVTTSSDEQIEAIAEDIEKCFVVNYTLGGTVISVELTSIAMDSGFAHPEGIAIFELTVKWQKQY